MQVQKVLHTRMWTQWVIALSALTLLFLMGSTELAMTQPSPLKHFTFDETSGTSAADEQGGSSAVVGGGAAWVSGKIGGGLYLDGIDDYVELNSPIYNNAAFTLAFWLKSPTPPHPDWQKERIYFEGNTTDNTPKYAWKCLRDGALQIFSQTPDSGGSVMYAATTTPTLVFDNGWHHLAFTLDGDYYKLYFDGGAITSGTVTKPDPLPVLDCSYIGTKVKDGSLWTDGFKEMTLDDFRMYDEALSALDIEDLFDSAVTATPVKHFAFDETSGTSAADEQGGPAAPVGGGATWVSGQIGGALSLDGVDDYVELNYPVYNTPAFSIAFWLKSPIPPHPDWQRERIYFEGNITDNTPKFAWKCMQEGTLQMWSQTPDSGGAVYYVNPSPSTVFDNTWHHLAFTLDGDDCRLYVDGDIDTSGTVTKPSPLPVLDRSYIGTKCKDGTLWTDGFKEITIDDFRLYDMRLTPFHVSELYNSALTAVREWRIY